MSLGELAVIGAVALVVIGPEKLPRVARTAGLLLGRARRIVAGLRADLEREFELAEMGDLKSEIQSGLDREIAPLREVLDATNAPLSEAPEEAVPPSSVPEPSSVAIMEEPADCAIEDSVPVKPKQRRERKKPALVGQASGKSQAKQEPHTEMIQDDLFAEFDPVPRQDYRDRR